MQGKLSQFNDTLKSNAVSRSMSMHYHKLADFSVQTTADLAMTPEQSSTINEIFTYLSQVIASPSHRPSKPLTSGHVDTVIQLLDRWPSAQLFPGTWVFP